MGWDGMEGMGSNPVDENNGLTDFFQILPAHPVRCEPRGAPEGSWKGFRCGLHNTRWSAF